MQVLEATYTMSKKTIGRKSVLLTNTALGNKNFLIIFQILDNYPCPVFRGMKFKCSAFINIPKPIVVVSGLMVNGLLSKSCTAILKVNELQWSKLQIEPSAIASSDPRHRPFTVFSTSLVSTMDKLKCSALGQGTITCRMVRRKGRV